MSSYTCVHYMRITDMPFTPNPISSVRRIRSSVASVASLIQQRHQGREDGSAVPSHRIPAHRRIPAGVGHVRSREAGVNVGSRAALGSTINNVRQTLVAFAVDPRVEEPKGRVAPLEQNAVQGGNDTSEGRGRGTGINVSMCARGKVCAFKYLVPPTFLNTPLS